MCAEHGFGKSSESTTVKRKSGRRKKQTEASFGRSEELRNMSVGHSCGKSSAAKRGRHTKPMLTAMTDTKAVTLEELQKGDRGWFTIKPAATIVALCWDRYSYHCCVKCRLRALSNAEWKYGCSQYPAGRVPCFRQRGRKRIAWGLRGIKCNMAIGQTVGEVYTNYTIESVEFAGYLP